MPVYEFKCKSCGFSDDMLLSLKEHDALPAEGPLCPKCSKPMTRIIGLVHTRVDYDFDSKPWGQTFKEHNERLKRREGTGSDYVTPIQKIRRKFGMDKK